MLIFNDVLFKLWTLAEGSKSGKKVCRATHDNPGIEKGQNRTARKNNYI